MQERRTLGYLKEEDIPSSAVKCEFNVGDSINTSYTGNVVYVPISTHFPMWTNLYDGRYYNFCIHISHASGSTQCVYLNSTSVGHGDYYQNTPLSWIYKGRTLQTSNNGGCWYLTPTFVSGNNSSPNMLDVDQMENVGVLGKYIKLKFKDKVNVRLGYDSYYIAATYTTNFTMYESSSNGYSYDYPLYVDTEE